MKYSFLDLLSPALIPELGSDVAAGTSCNIHLVLVAVSAVGAFPDELSVLIADDLDLSVISAYLAVIALGIKLCVHDIFIDVLHHGNDRIDVVLKVGNLDIADGSAGGQRLELGFELELFEGVDILGNVYVIGVGDVALIGNAGDDAESLLQAFCELVGGGLKRSSVK